MTSMHQIKKRPQIENNDESLSDQMEIEMDSNRHTCDQCPRTFSSLRGLQTHRGKSHKNDSQAHRQHQQNERFA